VIILRKILIRFFTCLFIIVVIVLGSVNITPVVLQKNSLEKTRLELLEKIHSTEKEISDLRDKQDDFGTDYEYVEFILHKRGLVWKNETVFIFED